MAGIEEVAKLAGRQHRHRLPGPQRQRARLPRDQDHRACGSREHRLRGLVLCVQPRHRPDPNIGVVVPFLNRWFEHTVLSGSA